MRVHLLVLACLVACSSAAPQNAAAPATITPFITADVTTIAAMRASNSPMIALVDTLFEDMLVCWRSLEQRIAVSYQVGYRVGSVQILEGDLPRAEVERCIVKQLALVGLASGDLRTEGELLVVPTKVGTAVAAWRGRYVIAGGRAEVEKALAASDAPKPLVAAVPTLRVDSTIAISAITIEPVFAGLLGVPTTQTTFIFNAGAIPWAPRHPWPDDTKDLDLFAKEQERKGRGLSPREPAPVAPPRDPHWSGSVSLTFATEADARRAAGSLAQRTYGIPLEENLAVAFARLPQTTDGTTLTVTFDETSFVGVSLERLQAWIATLQAGPAR